VDQVKKSLRTREPENQRSKPATGFSDLRLSGSLALRLYTRDIRM
jgi:hypothetical protein